MKFIRPIIVVVVLSFFGIILYTAKPNLKSPFARIDIKAAAQQQHQQFRVYSSDKLVERADWDAGIDTYTIHSEDEKISFQIRPISDCEATILLRGIYQTYKDLSRKKLWVKYRSLKINGKEILKAPVNVWHDKPFSYTFPINKETSYDIEVIQIK